MAMPSNLQGRYEIKEILGQGGMGLVFRAFDSVVKRDVALKTLRDSPTRAALQLFYKECEVLAALSHPNIIEIFDIGEFEEEGKSRPYFVMPLLPGTTLDKVIRDSGHRLTVERAIDIIVQTCRGLHAAHERGLIHRDLKPSNVFVMQDDSVKIIDFGVAHMVDTRSSVGPKGTLLYMAPEQLQMKPPSPLTDLFSVAVVCYETLTRRRPFERSSETEIAEAILHDIPPSAADLNPAVNQTLGRVVHKAMAKQPWHRFSSAREFADILQRAMRNETIEYFDPARIQPRIQRAASAFESGDHEFASEILGELEAEGHIDTAISMLRRQIDQAVRQKTISTLLNHARTRFEHEEYPLSLQKIQEILQIDPTNSAALGLKTSIQNKLTALKFDEWFKLARQHLENHAYSHARQALQNVLQVRPNESRALQMIAEVDRLEQEYLRVRNEKEQLYRSALDAWQSGDISVALTRLDRVLELDRRAPDSSTPERAAAYQNFYNQVRSEHDAIKNSYAEGRKLLADRNFSQALAVCNEILARRPGHALFQALKFDIEEQQRQELSARIAEIDREAEAEPDLDRRVGMLEEAVKSYPGEPHFEKALRLARDKRDLVNSIVGKARFLEERSQFNEALGQWEILGTIYSQYPGLNFEIERVIARRDQQARSEAKARWVEQIDRALESGECRRALELIANAKPEFPNDSELAELETLARETLDRQAEAERFFSDGRALCAERRYEEGMKALRRANELDPRNAAIRAGLVDALVEQARPIVDSDWRSAEVLVQQALEIDSGHLLAKSLRTLIHDRKREEEVVRCSSQVRQLRASGELKAALAEAEQCLASYPLEQRLVQLRDSLTKELQESQMKLARRSGLDELQQLQQESGKAAGPSDVEAALQRARAIAAQFPGDTEVQSALAALEGRLSASVQPQSAESPAPVPPHPAPAKRPSPRKPASRGLILGFAGAAVVVLAIVGAVSLLRLRQSPAAAVAVEIRTSPPGATLRINNEPRGISNLRLQLVPGKYQVEAVLDGFQPLTSTIEVKPESTAPVELALQPQAQTVRLISNLEGGQAVIDDQPPREMQDGQLTLDALAAGKHTLKISGRYGEAAFGFEIVPAAVPAITTPVTAKNVVALLVTAASGRARIVSSLNSGKVTLDGQPAGELTAGGLALSVSPGTHEVAIGEGQDHRKFIVEISPSPMLTALLQSDRNIGTILVLTGEDGVSVFINGQKYRGTTRRGQLRISREPKEYRIRIAKDGFEDEPERTVQVVKGEEVKLEFRLRRRPAAAVLAIRGATPGAQVLLDQSPIGTVDAGGNFSSSSISPGDHAIELRKDRFKPKSFRRRFAAGQTVQPSPGEVALESAFGTLRVNVAPAGAKVTIQRAGEAQARPLTETTASLPEGQYTLVARASGFPDRTERVDVAGGHTVTVDMALSRDKAGAATGRGSMDLWDKPGEWKADGKWYTHRGGDYVLFRPTPNGGAFAFTMLLQRGRRLQWVLDYVDDRNYLLFQWDKDTFRRIQCANGKKTEMLKKPHAIPQKDYVMVTMIIEATPGGIVHKVRKGEEWLVLDTFNGPGRNLAGRFGLYIPGKDEFSLSDFSFTPAK